MNASEILNLQNKSSVKFEAEGAIFEVSRNDTSLIGKDTGAEKYILRVRVAGDEKFVDALNRQQLEQFVDGLVQKGIVAILVSAEPQPDIIQQWLDDVSTAYAEDETYRWGQRVAAMETFAEVWGEKAIEKAHEVFMPENAQAFERWYIGRMVL